MNRGNVLDHNETIATAKALRFLPGNGRLGSTKFTFHDSASFSRYTVITTALPPVAIFKTTPTDSPPPSGLGRCICALWCAVDLTFDDWAFEDNVRDIFVEDVILAHFFECVNCNDVLTAAKQRP